METNSISKMIKLEEERSNHKVKCPHCGHILLFDKKDRLLCSHCKNYVYRDKKCEFKCNMVKNLKGVNNEDIRRIRLGFCK